MASSDPHPHAEDEQLAKRLSDFFATVNGVPDSSAGPQPPTTSMAEPPTSGARPDVTVPPPPPPPPSPFAATAVRDQQPTVDMVKLVKYLDAQLELTRQEGRRGVEQVLDAVTALDERLTKLEGGSAAGDPGVVVALAAAHAEFRDELFDWLEGYSGWHVRELAEVRALITQARDVLVPAAVPQGVPPPPAPGSGSSRFSIR